MKSKVKLKFATKPVFLEVESGYSTLGTFMIIAIEKGKKPLELFPEKVKKVHDNLPDIFLLPYEPADLMKITIMIYGKYSPAPYHTQIRVEYKFVQNAQELSITPKKSNIIEQEIGVFFKTFHNFFDFVKW